MDLDQDKVVASIQKLAESRKERMAQMPRLKVLLDWLSGSHWVDSQEELSKISDLWSPFVLGSKLEGIYSGEAVERYRSGELS